MYNEDVNLLRAQLLIEAADLLNEVHVVDPRTGKYKSGRVNSNTRKVMKDTRDYVLGDGMDKWADDELAKDPETSIDDYIDERGGIDAYKKLANRSRPGSKLYNRSIIELQKERAKKPTSHDQNKRKLVDNPSAMLTERRKTPSFGLKQR